MKIIHPDIALRYLKVVSILKEFGSDNKKILDIGAGEYGLSNFINKNVFETDINIKKKNSIIAQCFCLPFKKNIINIVVSIDLIEHLKEKEITLFFDELYSMNLDMIILGFPYGKTALKLDKEYFEKFKVLFKQEHKWIKEHLENNIYFKDIIGQIKLKWNENKYKIITRYNMNITLWKFINLICITKYKYINFLIKIFLYFSMPILRFLDLKIGKNFYRKILIIKKYDL